MFLLNDNVKKHLFENKLNENVHMTHRGMIKRINEHKKSSQSTNSAFKNSDTILDFQFQNVIVGEKKSLAEKFLPTRFTFLPKPDQYPNCVRALHHEQQVQKGFLEIEVKRHE